MIQEDFSSSLGKLHEKYGKLVRISPNEVSILDAKEVQRIYGHGTKFNKSWTWYSAWMSFDQKSSHFDDQNPVTHARRRRAVASVYSLNALLSLEQFIDTCSERFFVQLDALADGKTKVDLACVLFPGAMLQN